MNKVEIDTVGLSNLASSVDVYVNKFSDALDGYFNTIKKLDDCWKGPDADAFIDKVLDDKKNYDMLKLVLDDYVDLLNYISSSYENYSGFKGV